MIGFEPVGFDVHRVPELGSGVDLSGLDDLYEGAVFGEFPMNFDRGFLHATAGFEWLGREAGPKDHTFVIGITGGYSAGERIAVEVVGRSGRGVSAQKRD